MSGRPVAISGTGAWGTSLAIVLCRKGISGPDAAHDPAIADRTWRRVGRTPTSCLVFSSLPSFM